LRFIIWIFYSLRIDNQNLKKMQAKGYHNEEKEMCWWLFYKNNSQTNSLSYTEEPLRKLIPIISSSTSIHNETFSSRRPWLLTSCLHDHAIQIHQIEQLIMVRSRASLQDFTVLPMDHFRRCVIRNSSVIFLPTSSPTDYVRRLSLRRWFSLPSLYRSEKQKNHLPMVLQTEFARQKKKIPAWNIPTDFYSVGDIVIDRRKLSVFRR